MRVSILTKWTITLISLLFPSLVFSADLSVPEYIQVQSINGEKMPTSFIMMDRTYPLPLGSVTLSVRYKDMIESDWDDSHDFVSSDWQEVSFNVTSEEGNYQLQSARPSSMKQAEKFALNPSFSVLSQGEDVTTKAVGSSGSEPPKPTTDSDQQRALQMLEFWWQQADEQTQAEFLQHINQQPK